VNIEYDGVNRLLRAQDSGSGNTWQNYSYDANGNVASNGTIGFTYDFSNQPIALTGSVSSGAFVYDGNLKRAKQIMGGKTIYSVYSASGTLLHRDDATTNTTTDYVAAAGKTIARVKGTEVIYMHQDHLGSPVVATDAAGAIAWREDYTPYGEKRLDPFGNKDDESFTGHISDTITGLTYMQARYYDPVIGRFLSNDPISFDGKSPWTFNRYAYGANNPINMVDLTGKRAIWVVDKNGNETIQVMIAFSGPDAGNIAAQNDVISTLSNLSTPNNETIEVIVVAASMIGNKGVTDVALSATGFDGVCKTDSSCAIGDDNAYVDTSTSQRGAVGGHEVVHTMGANDGYQGSTGTGKNRTPPTSYNRPESDIMSSRTGTELGTKSLKEIKGDAIRKSERANNLVCRSEPDYEGC
jgi:RHS repeat-associated protein